MTLANGTHRLVKELKMGDNLPGGKTILCAVKTDCLNQRAKLIKIKSKNIIENNPVPVPALVPQGLTPVPQGSEDLIITPWHPIRINDSWQFPSCVEGAVMEEIECESVFSFLVIECESKSDCVESSVHTIGNNDDNNNMMRLQERNTNTTQNNTQNMQVNKMMYSSSMIINNIECITLAHNILDDNIASHPFFGTMKVVEELKKCKGWERGLIHFRSDYINHSNVDGSGCVNDQMRNIDEENNSKKQNKNKNSTYGCVVRDPHTGLITGFNSQMEL